MRLKEGLEKALGTQVQLGMAMPGALDVLVDGKKIFSKREAGRMPTTEELVGLIRT